MLGDLGKLIVAKGFKKLPKVQKIARSGHTGRESSSTKIYVGTLEHSCQKQGWGMSYKKLYFMIDGNYLYGI